MLLGEKSFLAAAAAAAGEGSGGVSFTTSIMPSSSGCVSGTACFVVVGGHTNGYPNGCTKAQTVGGDDAARTRNIHEQLALNSPSA